MKGLAQKVKQGRYTPISNFYSKELSNLLQKMLQINPHKRPSANEILSN